MANPYHAGDIHGQCFREGILLFLMDRPFPTTRDAFPHWASDRLADQFFQHENLLWYGLLRVANGGLSLPGFQQQVSEALPSPPDANYHRMMDVRMCLLSLQFSKGLRKLRNHDPRVLTGVQVHMGLVLARAQLLTLERRTMRSRESERRHLLLSSGRSEAEIQSSRSPDQAFDCVKAVVEYSGTVFGLQEQLRYIQVLRAKDKLIAYIQILKTYGVTDTLIGRIRDEDGSYDKGLLELAMEDAAREDGGAGAGGQAAFDAQGHSSSKLKFMEVMEHCGQKALERGQYIEALRLLHLAQKFDAVIHVLQRCLRLPLWDDVERSEQAQFLDQEVRRFMQMYENNGSCAGAGGDHLHAGGPVDGMMLGHGDHARAGAGSCIVYSRGNWHFLLKVYWMRQFFELCKHGRAMEALEVFDEQRFLADLDGVQLSEQANSVQGSGGGKWRKWGFALEISNGDCKGCEKYL
jgi:hypothetical protein